MEGVDWNKFAQEVTKWEGKKVQLSIAQVKEVIRIIASVAASEFDFCSQLRLYGFRILMQRHAEYHKNQLAKEKKCQTKKSKSPSKSRKPSKTKR